MRIKHLFVVIRIGIKGEVGVAKHVKVSLASLNMFKPFCDILLTIPRRYFFCGSFLLFIFHVCLYYTSCLFLAAL